MRITITHESDSCWGCRQWTSVKSCSSGSWWF